MGTTVTSCYDVAEHLRTPEDMAAYREACLEEAWGDATFIAQVLGHIARAKAWHRSPAMPACPAKAYLRHWAVNAAPASTRS